MWIELHSRYSHEQIAEKILEMSIEGISQANDPIKEPTKTRETKSRFSESVDQNLMFQQGLNIIYYRRFQKLRQELITEMTKKYIPLKKKVLSDATSDHKIVKLIEQRKALKQQGLEIKTEMDNEGESAELLQKKDKLDQKD